MREKRAEKARIAACMRYLRIGMVQNGSYSSYRAKLSREERGFGLDAEKVGEIYRRARGGFTRWAWRSAWWWGGGNFFRGVEAQAKENGPRDADNMGMLSTVINAIAAARPLWEQRGVQCRVMSQVFMNQIAEPLHSRRAVRHLEKGRVVVFAAGIGNPFFSTGPRRPACAPWRSRPMCCWKGTKVEGVYNADPVLVKDA